MKLYRRLSVLLLSMLLALAVAPLAAGQSSGSQVTVLFTHDLHSHLLPAAGEDGEPYGGYARLMSAIRAQRQTYPDALLLDGVGLLHGHPLPDRLCHLCPGAAGHGGHGL